MHIARARVATHVLARVETHVLVQTVDCYVLARVVKHVLARVETHVLARVLLHVLDYYSKTCIGERGGGRGNSGNARKKNFFLREGFPNSKMIHF